MWVSRITPQNGPRVATCLALGLLMALVGGCVTPHGMRAHYAYFQAADAYDPWSPKITGWQSREARVSDTDELRAPASVSGAPEAVSGKGGDLRAKYFAYRAERKRTMARELTDWIQDQAKQHYVADGPVDHWATLEDTLRTNGDDCDGLELLVYHFLLDLGFGEDEVFRSIVYRPSDGQHHMVTLWFEDANDPWVLDPTGAMTTRMIRMSDAPQWVPLKVFNEQREFTVQRRPLERPVQVTQR